jgi:hypothetical protein
MVFATQRQLSQRSHRSIKGPASFVFLATLHELRSRDLVMTAAAAEEHQRAMSPHPMTRENTVPRPRAIQPCVDMGASLLDVQTVTAQTIVMMRIADSAARTKNWPPLKEPRFTGSGGGDRKIAPVSTAFTGSRTGCSSDRSVASVREDNYYRGSSPQAL